MANNYDAADLNEHQQYQPPTYQMATKGQLNLALRSAIQEAQHLANYYDNVAKQLTMLATQVEQTK
jgi:hypothetical protein